jgi:hypothetical protein
MRELPSWLLALALAGSAPSLAIAAGDKEKPAARADGKAALQNASQTAREVFEGQDFWWKRTRHIADADAGMSWFAIVLEALGNLLKRIWEIIAGLFQWNLGLSGWPGGIVVIWLVVALALAWMLWKLSFWFWSWWAQFKRPGQSKASLPAQETLPEASVLLERAAQAAAAGEYSQALRFAFLALLASLQSDGMLRYDPSRTNREYEQDLKHESEILSVFHQVARPYERVWYGRYPADRPEVERVFVLCRRLVGKERAAQ